MHYKYISSIMIAISFSLPTTVSSNEADFCALSRDVIIGGETFLKCMELAKKGNAIAQFYLSRSYSSTKNRNERNYEKSVYWLKKSAEQGDSRAQKSLGGKYRKGKGGVKKDLTKSFYWYKKSAEQDNKKSMYYVAIAYMEGKGINQDNDKAIEWLKKSANKGYKRSIRALGKLQTKIKKEEMDKQQLAEKTRLAAKNKRLIAEKKRLAEKNRIQSRKRAEQVRNKRQAFLNSPAGIKLRNSSLIDLTTNGGSAGSCQAFLVATIGRNAGGTIVDVRRANSGMRTARTYVKTDPRNYTMAFNSTTSRIQNKEYTNKSLSKSLQACTTLGFY